VVEKENGCITRTVTGVEALEESGRRVSEVDELKERLRVCQEQNTTLEMVAAEQRARAEAACEWLRSDVSERQRHFEEAIKQRDDQRARADRLAEVVRWYASAWVELASPRPPRPALEPGDLEGE
jgi:hypothetical protein